MRLLRRSACPARPLPAAPIEDFVLSRLHEASEGGALADDVRARCAERLARDRAELTNEKAALPRAGATLSAEGQQLVSKATALSGPAAVWKVMTPPNGYRLVHALVHEVLVDEPTGEITATQVDFGAPLDPLHGPAPLPDPQPKPERPSLRMVEPTEACP